MQAQPPHVRKLTEGRPEGHQPQFQYTHFDLKSKPRIYEGIQTDNKKGWGAEMVWTKEEFERECKKLNEENRQRAIEFIERLLEKQKANA